MGEDGQIELILLRPVPGEDGPDPVVEGPDTLRCPGNRSVRRPVPNAGRPWHWSAAHLPPYLPPS